MSIEAAMSQVTYRKDDLAQASQRIDEAVALIEESRPWGRWVLVRILRVVSWWSRKAGQQLKG